jgi:hypothetical protein
VELSPALQTLDLIPAKTPRGIIIVSARFGTNDLDETIAWWREQRTPVWGVVPERVGIASGPEGRLSREGLELYTGILRRARQGRR